MAPAGFSCLSFRKQERVKRVATDRSAAKGRQLNSRGWEATPLRYLLWGCIVYSVVLATIRMAQGNDRHCWPLFVPAFWTRSTSLCLAFCMISSLSFLSQYPELFGFKQARCALPWPTPHHSSSTWRWLRLTDACIQHVMRRFGHCS